MGEFHVNYTVATPWTSPPYVRVTRRVIIDDIDECSLDVKTYEKSCPILAPRCDFEAGATCQNTMGSYSCRCPKYTSGDGFLPGVTFPAKDAPEGFRGGQECHDTGKPVIKLVGPNPKVFRICEWCGISGIMGKGSNTDESMRKNQQSSYETDIRSIIEATAGAELCATHLNPVLNARDCIEA